MSNETKTVMKSAAPPVWRVVEKKKGFPPQASFRYYHRGGRGKSVALIAFSPAAMALMGTKGGEHVQVVLPPEGSPLAKTLTMGVIVGVPPMRGVRMTRTTMGGGKVSCTPLATALPRMYKWIKFSVAKAEREKDGVDALLKPLESEVFMLQPGAGV